MPLHRLPRTSLLIALVLAGIASAHAAAAPAADEARTRASRTAAGKRPAATPPDTARARALLEKMAERYRSAGSYLFEGRIGMRLSMGEKAGTYEMPFLLAAMKPGRMRTEMANSGTEFVAICDGTHIINYLPRLKQYTQRDASPLTSIGDSTGLAFALASGTPLERPVALATQLRVAGFLAPQTIASGGRNVRCLVVEAHYQSVPGNYLELSPTTLWIDPDRHLVLRDSLQLATLAPTGDTVTTRQVTTYDRLAIDVPLPESLFTFVPPPGVERVDQPGEAPSPLVGKPAEDFTLADLSGKPRRLVEHRGKVVLLDFWATWCGPCRREMPSIARLHKELGPKGLAVVAVNVAEEERVVNAFLARYRYDIPIWMDPDGTVSGMYGATGLPTLVVIDREGIVAAHLIGLRSEDEVRAVLKQAGID